MEGNEDVQLDPPNELIDTSCMVSCSSIPTSRANSIGTLTSWQLLARQVAGQVDDEDATGVRKNQIREPSRLAAGLECSPRSASWTPGLQSVSPRPHQALYKEYRMLETIGKGAFGTVSVAVRRSDGKQLVAKEIASGQAALASAKQREAIMDEVNVLARLKHPNIVKYFDCFMDANYLIIIMEYCNSGDLAGLIKLQAGRLWPETTVMFLFVQICLAMHHVHAAGVLHRDLKTSNILVNKPTTSTPASSSAGRSAESTTAEFNGLPLLKLADFGVAKAGCDTDGSMAGTTVGTPHYLSPEMCDGKRYGKKTDVWALGCILYEIACLKKAFEASNIGGIYRKIAAAEYAPMPDHYSNGLKSLVGSLLARETRDRPSVAEVLCMPYVRLHLGAYLDWARNVPEAQPEVLLASITQSPDAAMSPSASMPTSRTVSQLLQPSTTTHTRSRSHRSAQCAAGTGDAAAGSGDDTGAVADSQQAKLGMALGSAGRQEAGIVGDAAAASLLASHAAVPCGVQQPDMMKQPATPSTPADGAPAASVAVLAQTSVPASSPRCATVSSTTRTKPAQPDSAETAGYTEASQTLAAATLSAAPVQQGPNPVPVAKPNPFYSAAAAMASSTANDRQRASAAQLLGCEGSLVAKQAKPKGLVCTGLDNFSASSVTEPSSELIMAFRSSTECTGPRRVSSASCSSVNTPKSPLGQYMHSWQQDELQEQTWQTAAASNHEVALLTGNPGPDGPSGFAVAPRSPGGSIKTSRSTEEYRQVTVPLPWLAANSEQAAGKRGSTDNWLSSLVKSLQQLEQAVPEGSAAQQPDSCPHALHSSNMQSAASPTYKDMDPSAAYMPCMLEAGNPVAAPASATPAVGFGNTAPYSLEGWLPGDGNLLQHMRRRSTGSIMHGGSHLNPGSGSSGRASGSAGSTFSLLPASGLPTQQQSSRGSSLRKLSSGLSAATACFQQHSNNQAAALSQAGCKPTGMTASGTGCAKTQHTSCAVLPASARQHAAPALASAQCVAECTDAICGANMQDLSGREPPASSSASKPPLLPAMAAVNGTLCSDDNTNPDDLPLAVMVKQCLSGNSFLYSRSPSPAPTQEIVLARPNCNDSSNSGTNCSGSSASSNNQDDSGRYSMQPEEATADLIAEQQDALSRFNAFRATLGILPASHRSCHVIHAR